MSRACVVGAGMTQFGVQEKPLEELFADAALPAIHDAGIDGDEIEALYFGNTMGGITENETHLAPKLASHLGLQGIPCQRFEDACATSSNAFKHAVQAVEAGLHDAVLVGGVERCTPQSGQDTEAMTRTFASASHREYEQPMGLTFPGVIALLTRRHMYEHGTTEEQLAEVAVKNHYHGQYNPNAHFGRETDVAEVLDSPLVADPFRLMDCCPFSDGASAVVVVSESLADSYSGETVAVTGIGHRTDAVPVADKPAPVETTATKTAAADAYDQADITAEAIDFAEVHDCFTGAEVMAIEALGLVPEGEGGKAATEGTTYLSGDCPVNPSGGLKAKGHPIGATGTAQIVELTKQLRGGTGERQVRNADTGVAHNLGGDTATAVVTVMEAAQ